MDTEPVTTSGRWSGEGTRIAGRAVIVGGIALGLIFGLGWGLLANWQADRLPVSEAAPPESGSSAQVLPFPTSPTSPPVETTAPVVPAPPLPSQSPTARPSTVTVAPPPPTTRPSALLAAHYATTTVWDTGYVASITITTAATGPQNYEVRLQLPAGVTLTTAWSSSASGNSTSTSGSTITLRGGPVSAGQSVVVGFQTAKDRALTRPGEFEPTSCAVNGNPCG